MRKIKQTIALVVAIFIIVAVAVPTKVSASKSIYEYEGVTIMAGDGAPFVPEMCNGVTYATGSNYGTVTTTDNNDPYFTIDMTDVTLNGKILAVKYRLSSGSSLANSFLYPETTAGGWGESEAGVLKTDKMTSSGDWQLVTYNINTELLGQGLLNATDKQLAATIKSLRISSGSSIDSTFDIAYAGTFNSVAEAETYDAKFSEIYTSVDTNYKVEVIPSSLSSVSRAYYNLNDDGVLDGLSLYNTAYLNSSGMIANPIKATWKVNFGTNESEYVVSGDNKYLNFKYDSIMSNNRYDNEVPYVFRADVLPGDMSNHFSGFVFNYGYENNASNIFFESNKVNKEASVAKSGIGVSIYPTYMEIYVLCVDENTGNLSQISQNFYFENRVDDGFHTFEAVDNAGGCIRFYFDENLVASVTYSKDKVLTGNAVSYSERYYRDASILGSDGKLLKKTTSAVISYTKAVAMGSRARFMKLDNICLEPATLNSSILKLDKNIYEANSVMTATVDYNNAAVVDGKIAIYKKGDIVEVDTPLIITQLGHVLTAEIELLLDPGYYFAVLIGYSNIGYVQYGNAVEFSITKTEKSFIVIDDTNATPGKIHKVTVSIPDNQGICYIALKVNYDTNYLTLTDTRSGEAFKSAIFTQSQNFSKNPYIMTWASSTNITESGVLAELSFDVSDNAEGSSEISVEIIEIYSSKYADSINDVTGIYLPDDGIVNFDSSNIENNEKSLALDGAFIALSDDVALSFYVKKAAIDDVGYINPVLSVIIEGKTMQIVPSSNYPEKNDSYVFEIENIVPNMFNDTVSATLTAELDGELITSETIKYSVSKYVYNLLEQTTDSELKTLLVDLLRYGAAAQRYTNYKTESLADAMLTSEQASYGTKQCRTLETVLSVSNNENDAPAKWESASLKLESNISMKVTFSALSTLDMCIKVTDEAGNIISSITEDAFVQETDNIGVSRYYFYFEELKAHQMSETVNFTICNVDGEVVGGTLTYSVESYAYSVQNEDLLLADLVKAMMMYGDSAYNYVN